MKIKTAKGLVLLYLKATGFKGWTSFWDTIYLYPGYENNQCIIRHEQEHLRQIKEEGKLKFSVKYLWFLAKYGYYDNPYEVQARKAGYSIK